MVCDLKFPFQDPMQILSAHKGAAHLCPSPDLGMVADTLAGGPIIEPWALHPSPFYLSVITAENITPVQSALISSAFHQLVVQSRFTFFLLISRVSIKEKKINPNTFIDPDLWQTENDTSACYDFFGWVEGGFVKEFPHITQIKLFVRICYYKSSLHSIENLDFWKPQVVCSFWT